MGLNLTVGGMLLIPGPDTHVGKRASSLGAVQYLDSKPPGDDAIWKA